MKVQTTLVVSILYSLFTVVPPAARRVKRDTVAVHDSQNPSHPLMRK